MNYYLVNLKHGDEYFSAICKEKYVLNDLLSDLGEIDFPLFYPFINYYVGRTFKDLVTGKTISCADEYPRGRIRSALTYEESYGRGETYVPGYKEISQEEALKMLKELTEEQIIDYKLILNDIEQKTLGNYKMMLEQKKHEKNVEKEIRDFARRNR